VIRGGTGITGSKGGNRLPRSLVGAGRNSLRYPKFWNLDLRLSRRIKFSETMNLEFIAEGFNIVNRTPILGNIDQDAYAISAVNNVPTLTFRPTFGTLTPPAGETLYKARQFQFAVRFEF